MNVDYSYLDEDSIPSMIAACKDCHKKTNTLSVTIVENSYILPIKRSWWKFLGGVVDSNGNIVQTSGERIVPDGIYEYDKASIKEHDATAIYVGNLTGYWGHALLDNFKRLWYLNTKDCHERIHNGARLYYSEIDGESVSSNVWKLINLAGFDKNNFIKLNSVSKFKEVIVPDRAFQNQDTMFWMPEMSMHYNKIRLSIVNNNLPIYDKIYLTQSKWGGRFRTIGEKRLEHVFKNLGFKIISPEKYSVEEQIWMYSHCKYFAATEGSISHNAIFCNPHTKITILRRCNLINRHQIAVNEIADLDVTYIDVHKSICLNEASPYSGPFYICLNRNLERYTGKYFFYLPYWLDPLFYIYISIGILKKIQRHWNIKSKK